MEHLQYRHLWTHLVSSAIRRVGSAVLLPNEVTLTLFGGGEGRGILGRPLRFFAEKTKTAKRGAPHLFHLPPPTFFTRM